jgi:hypothetical protein
MDLIIIVFFQFSLFTNTHTHSTHTFITHCHIATNERKHIIFCHIHHNLITCITIFVDAFERRGLPRPCTSQAGKDTMNWRNVARLLLVSLLTAVVSGQTNEFVDTTCNCSDVPKDPSRIFIAGIMDENAYPWCPDLFEFTVQQINQGRWGALDESQSQYVEYSFRNEECDEFTILREYWDLRTLYGVGAIDGVVGGRCSGATLCLARVTGKGCAQYGLLKY